MTVVTPSLADAVTAALLHARRAAASAVSAAASADSAAGAAEDVFQNFFYGILAADPGTRPDETPCQDGDLYYNSLTRALKMRADGVWIVVSYAVTQAAMLGANNLSDVSSVAQSRTNLGLGSVAVLAAGAANGAATLDGSGHLPAAQFDPATAGALAVTGNLGDIDNAATARTNLELGTAATKDAGAASGVADLDSGGKVPVAQLPAGTASGVASLDALGHVPLAQLVVGTANGIATLDGSGLVPVTQLPTGAVSPVSIAKATDYTTISGDQGKVIWVTTGSVADVTITLVGAGTAGDGATMIIAKADTGTKKVVIEDSDGTTVIAWLSSQYDTVCFRSNGSAWSRYWHRIVPRVDTYTSNGTWTKPPLAQTVFVSLQGPGGGGGKGAGGSGDGGSGGGGGARAEVWFFAANLSATETVTVPTGGTAGTAGAGGNGSPTLFGTTKLQAEGGKGGNEGGSSVTGDGGGVWGAIATNAGGGGFEGAAVPTSGVGRSAVYGGGSGGVATSAAGGDGGSSVFGAGAGGGGGNGSVNGDGGDGGKRNTYTPGGGGAGGATAGAAGASGGSLGVGGGGGAGDSGGTGGAGGVGGVGAGGGGGGGGGAGGYGGAGGRGEAIVTTVF